ncbi:unnamed protein product [Eruca vesicaria subsp. sativa]|uniref:Uncharacterized protein n=1 Tax=Eruca vesicaria subsp. sativa TaxID=29727 RepID=A0ABC8LTJ0_ERUVS|nr:unnamed protein product [Eruca vesicaria subsp. sativa]
MVISKKTIVLSLALVAIVCIVMTTTEATHPGSAAIDNDHKSCASGTCKSGSDDEPFNPGCEPGSGRRCRAG